MGLGASGGVSHFPGLGSSERVLHFAKSVGDVPLLGDGQGEQDIDSMSRSERLRRRFGSTF